MEKKVASTTEKKKTGAQESLAGNGLKQMIQKYIRATSSKHRDDTSRRNMSTRYNSRSEAEDTAAEESMTDETAVEDTAAYETVAEQLAADEMAAVNKEESK